MIGIVKKWKTEGGYGFIQVEGQRQDIFVHCSDIADRNRRELQVNEHVQFETEPGKDGRPRAVNVRVL